VVDQAFLDEHDIDYIAHDELVYPSKTHDDVYMFAKSQGESATFHKESSQLTSRPIRPYSTNTSYLNIRPPRTYRSRLQRRILRFQTRKEWTSRITGCRR
jgi:glycerol-3-phosphate cytidylyltransferase-like family protein